MLARVLCTSLLAVLTACVSTPPPEPAPPEVATPEPVPLPPPAEPEEPRPSPAPVVVPQAEPPPPARLEAAILLSDRSPAYENVANELGKRLELPLVYNLADKSQSPEDAFAGMAAAGTTVVIAIGFAAATVAVELSPVPVVYCQVFNSLDTSGAGVPVKGVASIPPLALQVREWKKVDPGLGSIGAIVGDGHDKLIAEAAAAAAQHGVALHHRVSGSDRETLYIFQRLATQVDGFWLFPDNRILSLSVLERMIDVAARHQVRIAVFNHALLAMGAPLSTAAAESDIAEKIISVATGLLSEGGERVPDLTPLNVVEVRQRAGGPPREQVAAGDRAGGRPEGGL